MPIEDEHAYSAIRVVRESPGEPSKPTITVPDKYELVSDGDYSFASRGEYYVFIKGKWGIAKQVKIEWPGERIKAVISGGRRLKLQSNSPHEVVCDVMIKENSLRQANRHLDIHSHFNEEDLWFRVEHNHPDRAAGYYVERPWVEGQSKAVLNYMYAVREIFRDWGVHHQIAQRNLGRITIMGFESNNAAHGDSPPHWHLAYYWPRGIGSQVPHFYVDQYGCITHNRVVVLGRSKDSANELGVNDPMSFVDPNRRIRFACAIRKGGGLYFGPEPDRWYYAIVSGEPDTRFVNSVRVLRLGKQWRRIEVVDDVVAGILTCKMSFLQQARDAEEECHYYDYLTGAPTKVKVS